MTAGDGDPTTQNRNESGLARTTVLGNIASTCTSRLECGVPSHHAPGTKMTKPRRIRIVIVAAIDRQGYASRAAPTSPRGGNHGSLVWGRDWQIQRSAGYALRLSFSAAAQACRQAIKCHGPGRRSCDPAMPSRVESSHSTDDSTRLTRLTRL